MFEVVGHDKNGNEVKYQLIKPNASIYRESQSYSNKILRAAIENGDMLRSKLRKYLIQQGIWSEEKDKQLEKLDEIIEEKLLKLKKGGIKLSEGRKLAIEIRGLRLLRTTLVSEKNTLDDTTVEGQAENARFDYLVYACLVDEEGNRVFKSVEDYKNNGDLDYAFDAASKLAGLLYGLEADWEQKLPENKFLIKHNLVNEDLRLVNKEGKFIDLDGNLVDENHRRINENNQPIDENGNIIDEDGLELVESLPFEDDL